MAKTDVYELSSSEEQTAEKPDATGKNHAVNLGMEHLKETWKKEAREVMGATMASIYATLLVCVYIAFSFTELTKFPENKDFLEIYGFFTYLYLVATSYMLYILCYIVKDVHPDIRVLENPRVSISIHFSPL